MRWYKNLYVGENASKTKYKTWDRISMNKLSPGMYLLTLASNEKNLIDIIPADMLKQKHFKKEYSDEVRVIGLAKGQDEAFELVRQIVDEVYSNTGGFDIRGYLHWR